MSEHAIEAFSASPRWIPCPGSMAYPENIEQGQDGGVYADEGTAAHTLAAILLKSKTGMKAGDWVGKKIKGGLREFEITEEFAGHVQTYVEDVQRRAIGGFLMVEQRVTLEGVEGFDESNYGTSDAIIGMPARVESAYGVIEDLKFGQGEKVYAWTRAAYNAPFKFTIHTEDGENIEIEPNYQLMLYALACLADIRLLIDDPKFMLLVISQPRLGHISELRVPIAVLERFGLFAADALKRARTARKIGVEAVEHPANAVPWLNPGEKQCRWCRAFGRCPAAAKKVQQDVAADFETIQETPGVPVKPKALAKALQAVPFVMDWCHAVTAQAHKSVAEGVEIIGVDGKPYKFVEGKQGDRKWADEAAAEALLLGQLGPDAYAPQKILTASAASKLLDKKATKAVWNDVFVPLIQRAPGKPKLVMGSDPRPSYSPAAGADEFDMEYQE
jgi:Protein of unknown function (DUF2800)